MKPNQYETQKDAEDMIGSKVGEIFFASSGVRLRTQLGTESVIVQISVNGNAWMDMPRHVIDALPSALQEAKKWKLADWPGIVDF